MHLSMTKSLLLTAALLVPTVLVPACTREDDRCVEHNSAVGFDDIGPWGATPREAVGHANGARTGMLSWHGGGAAGSLVPAESETGLSLALVIHEDSAIAVEREHVGDGRLACISSFELTGTLTLDSDDGALQEQLEVVLTADDGVFGNVVEGLVLLDGHTFAGTLDWAPASEGELFLRLSWTNDASGSARGWLVWGDFRQTEVEGSELTGAGVVQILADFEAGI